MIRVCGGAREGRAGSKPGGEARGPTPGLLLELRGWSAGGAGGIHGVAVKCLDIMKTTDREGRFPECN